ncbi:1-hydroxycarotenoid 3,4-desaturase CrtD [Tropicibacter alexandrii]|uniref:1-hydroxycarotenoid 3,4-desaturase CrtD n=1 Tax=Tropicibacter alexandrii TaxID=2267683 RepID=UPI000EF52691|nr:1-hydroxycarotenoid 3,4-desaturase CrtD [Tropicibacter alexandrii]
MTAPLGAPGSQSPVAIIGAGIGGLVAATLLARAGRSVRVFERHDGPGGKMRTVPSAAGPIDAGPTVLTMRGVFDEVFAALGARLDDHVTLVRQPLLARHFWPDGSTLDLFDESDRSAEAIHAFAGSRAARQFRAFDRRARALFAGFDGPVMRAPRPSLPRLIRQIALSPRLLSDMAPGKTLADLLTRSFDDPRLAQLFGRYATYVGGAPHLSPGLLSLIWQAEARGVWVVRGGMHRLARALEELAKAHGARFDYGTHVEAISVRDGRVTGLVLDGGEQFRAETVLFNGDPRALATGLLGPAVTAAAPGTDRVARSLSADVWTFAAKPHGPDLAHHNVFFRAEAQPEFDALMRGERLPDPTLYICAMDRGTGPAPALERFEIIANAPPLTLTPKETSPCPDRCFPTLARFGLRFDPQPGPETVTTPQGFETLFPGSAGALYGQSPHGMLAAFRRPTALTPIKGLVLAGGGTHPGAGVPMAALSGRHAAEAILQRRISTLPSRRTATRGGISTA